MEVHVKRFSSSLVTMLVRCVAICFLFAILNENCHVLGNNTTNSAISDGDGMGGSLSRLPKELCPCLPEDICPHPFGTSPEDARYLGEILKCAEPKHVRCCGITVNIVTETPKEPLISTSIVPPTYVVNLTTEESSIDMVSEEPTTVTNIETTESITPNEQVETTTLSYEVVGNDTTVAQEEEMTTATEQTIYPTEFTTENIEESTTLDSNTSTESNIQINSTKPDVMMIYPKTTSKVVPIPDNKEPMIINDPDEGKIHLIFPSDETTTVAPRTTTTTFVEISSSSSSSSTATATTTTEEPISTTRRKLVRRPFGHRNNHIDDKFETSDVLVDETVLQEATVASKRETSTRRSLHLYEHNRPYIRRINIRTRNPVSDSDNHIPSVPTKKSQIINNITDTKSSAIRKELYNSSRRKNILKRRHNMKEDMHTSENLRSTENSDSSDLDEANSSNSRQSMFQMIQYIVMSSLKDYDFRQISEFEPVVEFDDNNLPQIRFKPATDSHDKRDRYLSSSGSQNVEVTDKPFRGNQRYNPMTQIWSSPDPNIVSQRRHRPQKEHIISEHLNRKSRRRLTTTVETTAAPTTTETPMTTEQNEIDSTATEIITLHPDVTTTVNDNPEMTTHEQEIVTESTTNTVVQTTQIRNEIEFSAPRAILPHYYLRHHLNRQPSILRDYRSTFQAPFSESGFIPSEPSQFQIVGPIPKQQTQVEPRYELPMYNYVYFRSYQ